MTSSPEKVVFNAGGTKYEVARSIIQAYPSTMLAKLVSETWQQPAKANKEVFIDRDGLQFRYVLSYMRDQKVYLPMGVAKASILQDLAYFGFENVPEDAIGGSCNYEAAVQVQKCKQKYATASSELDKAIKDMQTKKELANLARNAYNHVISSTDLILYAGKSLVLQLSSGPRRQVDYLNQCLSKGGLKFVSPDTNGNVRLAPL
ncbi:POZ domain-containing protein KCTD4 [Seminavis robusta]|uniref:POZ domain-containing protein KCTD4 n=1 Tax=Seminavis robusta TaxID=568900 RepID=A0A9N8EWE4_9STRA|nr:POZ domain-containing protein KCTD4 [Seminavis robusta]|eukprot:Sro2207_g319100.1 POZ domain-containing protein KCTD4 (204) ;mRNA; f:10923-11534